MMKIKERLCGRSFFVPFGGRGAPQKKQCRKVDRMYTSGVNASVLFSLLPSSAMGDGGGTGYM